MASAILTVLWPEDFTVYDIRVCSQLKSFLKLADLKFEKMWPDYLEYRNAVIKCVPIDCSLRDKDKYLWGKSSADQLENDIQNGFTKTSEPLDLD